MQVMHCTQIHMQRFRLAPSTSSPWRHMQCHRLLVARVVPQRPEMAAVLDRQVATDTVDIQQLTSAESKHTAKQTPSQRRNLRRKRKAASRQDTSPDEAASDDSGPGEQAALHQGI